MHPESYRPVVFWCNDIHYADRKFLREYHTQFLVGKKQNKNDPWWSFKLNQEISSISNKFFLQAWADSIFSVTNGKAQRAMSDFMTLFCSRLLVFHKIGTDPLACLKKVNLFPEIRRRKTAGILSQSLCLLALTENRLFSRQLSDSFLSAFSHQPKKSWFIPEWTFWTWKFYKCFLKIGGKF